MAMTTAETMAEMTRRGQEAFARTMRIYADAWKPVLSMWPALDAKAPSAEEVVDKAYDFAAQALATQREFTKSMLAATRSAASSAAWMAKETTNAAGRKEASS
jgi:pyoverdine/dityrosine biosynthesis protein Dit1